jgi:RimJ/RimL family protein N-acetyltransferase
MEVHVTRCDERHARTPLAKTVGPARTLSLPNALVLHIRSLQPGDDGVLRELYAGLSPRTRYFRFLSPMPRLPESVLTLLTSDDGDRRLTLVGEVDLDGGAEVVAVGDYCATDDGGAELGLVVRDAWQRRGIGTAVATSVLDAAEARGFERFIAYMHADNAAMRRLLSRVGLVVSSRMQRGVSEVSFVRRPRVSR